MMVEKKIFLESVNSIRNYIQTHQEEYKEDNSKKDSLSRKEANNGDQ